MYETNSLELIKQTYQNYLKSDNNSKNVHDITNANEL